MTTTTTSVTQTIERNHKRFTTDPDYVRGLKAVDHKSLAAATEGLKEKIASLVNYYVFSRSMKSMKLIKGSLSDTAEKTLVVRGRETLEVFQDVSSRIGQIHKALAASGLDKAMDRHMEALCQHLPHNPKTLAMLNEIKEMGITDAEISCVSEELRKDNYNILKYGGAGGTFAGFASLVESLNKSLEKEQTLMEKFGLPTVQGAMPASSSTVAVVVVVVVVAILLCIFTVFY